MGLVGLTFAGDILQNNHKKQILRMTTCISKYCKRSTFVRCHHFSPDVLSSLQNIISLDQRRCKLTQENTIRPKNTHQLMNRRLLNSLPWQHCVVPHRQCTCLLSVGCVPSLSVCLSVSLSICLSVCLCLFFSRLG